MALNLFLLIIVCFAAGSHGDTLTTRCGSRLLTAPLTASYSYKHWCEIVHKQTYFHHESSGGCFMDNAKSGMPWTDIEIDELESMIKSENIQLFDVRERDEIEETGLMPHAVNIPLGEVDEAFSLSPTEFRTKYNTEKPNLSDTNIIFSCLGGYRSRLALEPVHKLGFLKRSHDALLKLLDSHGMLDCGHLQSGYRGLTVDTHRPLQDFL